MVFASEIPLGTSIGAADPTGRKRKVDLVVNGYAVESKEVPADDKVHELTFTTQIDRSSWVALRHYPQMHTNPVNVLVGDKPIRASRKSALWCIGTIEQLWRMRENDIYEHERKEAFQTFQKSIEAYRKIAAEAEAGS